MDLLIFFMKFYSLNNSHGWASILLFVGSLCRKCTFFRLNSFALLKILSFRGRREVESIVFNKLIDAGKTFSDFFSI